MARNRTVKPEFWASEQIMDCRPLTRLTFIGIWNFCDDEGRHPWAARRIKAELYPSDDITSDDIEGMLSELSRTGLIEDYTVDGVRYFQVTGWQHQLINHPQKPRYPDKNGELSRIFNPLTDGKSDTPARKRRNAAAVVSSGPGTVTPDRIGKDTKGQEGKETKTPSSSSSQSAPPPPVPAPASSDDDEKGNSGRAGVARTEHDKVLARLDKAANGNLANGSPGIENIQPITDLIAQGCDLDLDILLVIKNKVAKLDQPLRTWAAHWFRDDCLAAKAKRIGKRGSAAAPEAPAGAPTVEEWVAAIKRFQVHRMTWNEARFGDAKPDDPDCRAPDAAYAEAGMERPKREAPAPRTIDRKTNGISNTAWDEFCEAYKASGEWVPGGPKPGEKGCKAPVVIQEKYGFRAVLG